VLNNRNVTNSDQRLLCVTAPSNDPSKNWLAADRPTAALGHMVSKHASVLTLPALPSHPQRVCGPPTMIFTSTGAIMPPPSLVVPNLGTTNDLGVMTAAASVA